jgi:hypothetical protein
MDIGHAGSFLEPSDVPSCNRYGAVGCFSSTDKLNKKLIKEGIGIPGLPETGGDSVGPGFFRNDNQTRKEDGWNGKYEKGKMGFIDYLKDAWEAAKKEASNLCKESCCKKHIAKVKTRCNSADAKHIMKKWQLSSWCNKEWKKYCK